jgi:sugar phosphate isomerase/epimerase
VRPRPAHVGSRRGGVRKPHATRTTACARSVHAKGKSFDPVNLPLKDVLDTTLYERVAKRSWVFRTVGYRHGALEGKQYISALRTVGYDGVVSIEHEDALASPNEGLRKAVATLQEALLELTVKPWWSA